MLASTLSPPVYDRYDIGAFGQLQTTLGVPR